MCCSSPYSDSQPCIICYHFLFSSLLTVVQPHCVFLTFSQPLSAVHTVWAFMLVFLSINHIFSVYLVFFTSLFFFISRIPTFTWLHWGAFLIILPQIAPSFRNPLGLLCILFIALLQSVFLYLCEWAYIYVFPIKIGKLSLLITQFSTWEGITQVDE